MGYDEKLAARIREHATGEPVMEKKMFGGLAFLLGGHMAVAASGQGGLLVRCRPERTADLAAEPGASPMVMRGKEMEGWLRVTDEAVVDEKVLGRWVDRGLDFARSLPPK